jgi:2-haloacid dehalogenase
MTYTWLLFDADDTLFDFPRAEANALQWTLEQIGLVFTPKYFETYDRCNKQVWLEFERGELTSDELKIKRFRLFLDEIGHTADPAAVSPLYLQNLARGTDLLEGAESVIRTLKPLYHLALVTNGLTVVQYPRLRHSAISDCFEHVFVSEELGVVKPSREYFDVVFEKIGQPPRENVLIVGDSLTSDMRGGIDYGIHTCWYNPKGKTTDLPVTYQISRLVDLLEILAK